MSTPLSTVPATILAQLGGNRFLAMTGARSLVYSETMLRMSLPTNPKRIAKFDVTLDSTDTYVVRAWKNVRKNGFYEYEVVEQHSFIYAEQLEETFTHMTGLYTRL